MSEKGLYYPVIRRIITIVVFFVIAGGFIAIYYFTYLPQEHALYNLRMFRILHEVAANFNQRVENYGAVYSNNYVSQTNKDIALHTKPLLADTNNKKGFDSLFRSSFRGNALSNDSFSSKKTIEHDYVVYRVSKKSTPNKDDTTATAKTNTAFDTTVKKPLSEILEPVISIHSDAFESFLLIKQAVSTKNDLRYDSILYKSENSDIANINTDSIFQNRSIENPVISDINIEGIAYKMYLLPFKMKCNPETFVLAGVVSYDNYHDQSQSIPVSMLLSLCLVIIVLLLSLPFLKIFFLSAEENININDVRAIITVIFIIPFFITLISSGIWLSMYNDKFSTDVLSSLQNNVQQNFYKEISDNIQQAKRYDSIIKQPSAYINFKNADSLYNDSTDLKDIVFYPTYYKNLTSLHWMDANGNDIAAWTFKKIPSSYFKLADRQYFRDIKFSRGYFLPDSSLPGAKEAFSLQPALSRLTGEYTVNVAIHSNAEISHTKKAIAVGISSRMYSVYNTIVPKGFAYSIIDDKGNIICDSDTARSLQENIFEESGNSAALRSIVNHKDSVSMQDFNLFDQSVKMIVKPLPGLPYYLITYYNKRGEYLYMFHILAFVFICEGVLLLFVSLFSYFMMLSEKKNSKLFFTSATLSWLRPSRDKKNYYIKNSIQFAACVFFVGLVSLFFSRDEYYLYTLNAGLLLPLFTITGYHIIKRARTFFRKEPVEGLFLNKRQFIKFLGSLGNILLLYIISVVIFKILQNVLFFNKACEPQAGLRAGIWALIILMPLIISFIAGINFDHKNQAAEEREINNNDTGYLTHFIISLLLAVALISVIPAVIFMSYAFREEKTLQLQSFQVDLAKKIQQRRNDTNPKNWQTKLNTPPFKETAATFINELKFKKEKGIYLLTNDTLVPLKSFGTSLSKTANCSPFYKLITQYLFLPPDHDEFYDDSTHNQYYYWLTSYNKKTDEDTLRLYFNNTTDNKPPPAFSLTSVSARAQLFNGLTENYIGLLVLLGLAILILLFYKVIYSVSVRIFLIGFFENISRNKTNKPDEELEKQSYRKPNFIADIRQVIGADKEVNFAIIREKENEKMHNESDADTFIIELHLLLQDVYENIWKSCTDIQKYTLHNFAIDGFTNYKKVLTLYELYKCGLIIKEEDGNVTLITKSFRNFLITKESSPEIRKLDSQGKRGSWSSLRTFFYIILIALAVFIFISQEEASKRLITIVTSLGALLPAMLKLFDKSTSAATISNKSEG